MSFSFGWFDGSRRTPSFSKAPPSHGDGRAQTGPLGNTGADAHVAGPSLDGAKSCVGVAVGAPQMARGQHPERFYARVSRLQRVWHPDSNSSPVESPRFTAHEIFQDCEERGGWCQRRVSSGCAASEPRGVLARANVVWGSVVRRCGLAEPHADLPSREPVWAESGLHVA